MEVGGRTLRVLERGLFHSGSGLEGRAGLGIVVLPLSVTGWKTFTLWASISHPQNGR